MSNRELDRTPEPTGRGSALSLRRAWTGVLLVPLFFLIAFAAGEGIYAVLGYKPENADAPAWVVVVASGLILLIALIPCVAAVFFGWRTSKGGDRRGALPAVIGVVVGMALMVLTVASEAGNVVR